MAKGLKLKVRKFSGLIPTFAQKLQGKTGRGDLFDPPLPPPLIMNMVKGLRSLDIFDESINLKTRDIIRNITVH